MMHGRAGEFLKSETVKPKNVGETLARLGKYFGQFWFMLILALAFVVTATWTQVTTPELIGQATDCFLVPNGSNPFASFSPTTDSQTQTESSCWLAADAETLNGRQAFLNGLYNTGGYKMADPVTATVEQRTEGLMRLILFIVILFVAGSVLNGMTFFAMSWTGQHVLRQMRVEVFEQLHRLSLSYYAEHEAGDLMSRITNDT
ncbi:MAG: hypothetical protein HYZ23_01680, partial [Chloroflexi bacterium]|nr:hypothetical protein [Chloroflexota bacterium]